MKRGTTLFLKIAVILVGVPALVLCVYGLPWLVKNPVNPYYASILYPIFAGIYLTIVPYFFALYQALKLLNYIDRNNAFSQLSVKALKNIKYCAFSVSIIYTVMLSFVYLLAKKDDSPGLIIIALIPLFAALVVAVFAAVLQKLLQEVIEIKLENDLTV